MNLLEILTKRYGLKGLDVPLKEVLAVFLITIAYGLSNRMI